MSDLLSPGDVVLGETPLDLETIERVAVRGARARLGDGARARMLATRAEVDAVIRRDDPTAAVYGINTGFGALAEVRISAAQLAELQLNLVRSHAAGVGQPLDTAAVRAMMLLRAQVLALGSSGARPECAERLCAMLAHGIHPIVPSRGSVGASGDLAPLAHLALALVGEGHVEHQGRRVPAADALAAAGLQPLVLAAKEGLTLLNGTQHMTAVGALAVLAAERAARLFDLSGALALEAYLGTPRAFDPRIHAARPHPGQGAVARNMARLLAGSPIVASHAHCGKVQDPYSFRCIPQVHGATRDTLAHVRAVLEREAASATDNPLVFLNDDGRPADVLSGGNFHGQPVAMALDFAAIATAELGSIAERRIEQLVNPALSGTLPAFLAPEPGLNSGFMIAQVTAAALVSENKILCHPASVDSIPTSAGREDHVSMGAHAALKLARVVDQVNDVLAIELLCACQAIDLRAPLRPAPALAAVHDAVRAKVPVMRRDRAIAPDIAAVRALVDDGTLLAAARARLPELE
jgi:histidine ammonia-lyase